MAGAFGQKKRIEGICDVGEMTYHRLQMHTYGFWRTINISFFIIIAIFSLHKWRNEEDPKYFTYVGIVVTLFSLLNVFANFSMYSKHSKLYKKELDLKNSEEEMYKKELKELEEFDKGKGSGSGRRSKRVNPEFDPDLCSFLRMRMNRSQNHLYEHGLGTTSVSSISSSNDSSFLKEGTPERPKKPWLSADPSTAAATSQSPSEMQVADYMRDEDIPVPTIYPLTGRLRDSYGLTNPKEIRQLIRDFEKAKQDLPVYYCFHPGQREKYRKYLSVPREYIDSEDMWSKIVYQPSPVKDNNTEEVGVPINDEFWRRFKISPVNFVSWAANLRIWITNTILHSLIEEIDVINTQLKRTASTVSVGNVGLDVLLYTARNPTISQSIPNLAILIPYLQISNNQKYVVQRLRELAIGNTMKDFSWNAGGSLDDKPWEPHLPSDAELIMHCIVTYFDTMMPLTIEAPTRQPFSSYYFSKSPDSPPNSEIVIYQQRSSPPYYQLLVKGEVFSIPSGAYNMFLAILLFVHYIKTYHDGVLGRYNLGRTGANILWTLDGPSS